jgi:demethylmenaquinone methyltransferase/2-methoxy-6-polyprenyl-1,4-benzoquinol methylase
MSDSETHFGFRRVRAADKAGLVRDVFDRVAGRYDLMNDAMSLGLHRAWKDAFVGWLAPRGAIKVADLAGGTGDIARRILARAPAAEVTVVDINAEMLAIGRGRVDGVGWACGDAERLPLPDGCMDAVTIAFGIRNCTAPAAVLVEARRVLRPGGRFLCLEFSRPQVLGLDGIYDAWSFRVIPRLGRLLAGDRDAYQYLVESIRQFPDQQTFAAMIERAGLGQVKVRNLAGGIAAMHSAWRI